MYHLPCRSRTTLPSAGLFRNLDSSGLGVCCGRKSTMLRGVASLTGLCKYEERQLLAKCTRQTSQDLSSMSRRLKALFWTAITDIEKL